MGHKSVGQFFKDMCGVDHWQTVFMKVLFLIDAAWMVTGMIVQVSYLRMQANNEGAPGVAAELSGMFMLLGHMGTLATLYCFVSKMEHNISPPWGKSWWLLVSLGFDVRGIEDVFYTANTGSLFTTPQQAYLYTMVCVALAIDFTTILIYVITKFSSNYGSGSKDEGLMAGAEDMVQSANGLTYVSGTTPGVIMARYASVPGQKIDHRPSRKE